MTTTSTTPKPTAAARTEQTDVLIVGAGPAGLTATALLARDGVRAITINKYDSTAHTPRAHITNQRAMEVFRDLGIEQEVLAHALPGEGMGTNVWATSVVGRELARMHAWGSGPDRHADYEQASPSPMCNIGQHELEPILRHRAEASGADLRFGHELIAITQDDTGVTADVLDRATGENYQITAQYAVGADGGRSLVASSLGFEFDGETGLGSAVNVWLEADLTAYREHRPGSLFFTIQPGRDFWLGAGTFVTVKPWTEFVLIVVYDPTTEKLDQSVEAMTERAHRMIGDPDVPITIKNISEWQLNHVVAQRYREGRTFLVGDAAHRHPPANGLGSNTSVQDSWNLAWKLSMVTRGLAGDALLDSYHDERQPVGRQVVDRAMDSVVSLSQVPAIFGVEAGQSEEEGNAALDRFFADTEEGRERRARLREVLEDNNYQFNAHGVELGQRYTSSAVVTDGQPMPRYTRDSQLYYHPTSWPGAYLPHVWVVRDGRQVSTLDLTGRGEFTLLTGVGGREWVVAAEKVSQALGVPIRTEVIGRGQVIDDPYGDWAAQCEIAEDGALLVRPDRHVAWRATDLGEDPTTRLETALRSVLGREQH
ncbi:FAD-dependent monooxygenase [Flexivirga meconopsidis]|uniref:FAD-dependent monooxygenase n=1 Tax=Flexivirga meconopsidis TaxID=2977121 RepID=UPI002240D627|nr:FAD-dependent monooxygenase [Flexivirga meconopsidis]